MANKTFETYFGERTVLTGAQAVAGDEVLVLRSGTVFRGSNVYIKANAILSDDATPTPMPVTDQWEAIAGTLTVDVLTPSLTFAANQFTYVSPNQIDPTVISASVSLRKKEAGAGEEVYEVGIFVNASLIGNGIKATVVEGVNPEDGIVAVTVQALHVLQVGDVIEFKVRNRTGTDDVTVQNAQLVVG